MGKTSRDDHGQPLNRLYSHKRLNDRTIDELLGMVKGITADQKVNQLEAEFLLSWMERNTQYCEDRIVNMLYSRISDMLSDNILDKDEQKELMDLLKSISGEHCPADKTETTAATFPLNIPPPPVDFPGSVFCLTGKFAYGPRRICSQVVTDLGGVIKKSMSKHVDYLVIGSLSSSDWIHTSYGRKIEKAMALQDDPPFKRGGKAKIFIVHEDHWAGYAFSE